jgi:gliding motility-associated-like protein
MKTCFSFVFFLLIVLNTTIAQNLVLNPSFEDHTTCNLDSNPSNFNTNVHHWPSLNYNNSYFNTCEPFSLNNGNGHSVPKNLFGFQYPKTGNGYALVYVLNGIDYTNPFPLPGDVDRRYYLQGKFNKILIKDYIYCVNYYVNRTQVASGMLIFANIKNVDAHISDTILKWNNGIGKLIKNITPQITSKHIISDTANWTKISGLYKAHGGEKHITIGNFTSDNLTEIQRISDYISDVAYFIDDVSVTPLSLTAPTLGKDTLLCMRNLPYTLTAPAGYDSLVWSNGSTGNTLQVTTPGTYWLKCIATGCGELYDTIKITLRNTPTLNLPTTATLCLGDSLTLSAQQGFDAYYWQRNNLPEPPTKTIHNPGTYTIKATEACGTQYDTITVTQDSLPIHTVRIRLGADTTLCNINGINQPITLTSNVSLPNYNWSNGATTPNITINQPTFYALTAKYYCGILTDTVRVHDCAEPAPYGLYIPNAFTPNADKLNETFYPKYYNITMDDFKIYTRRGNCVYELSHNPKGWDGMYKDLQCPTGEYVYKLLYTNNITDTVTQKVGKVMLLRD